MTEHDIDWDCEEAKGCKWVICNIVCGASLFVEYYPYINSSRTGFCCSFSDKVVIDIAEDEFSYWKVIKRPEKKDEPENIYTEEMFDAGEECEVGMSFSDQSGGVYKKLLPSDDSGMTVIKDKNGEYCIFCQSEAMPFDTRTDKQKLTDQIDNYIIDKNINAIDTEKFIDAIMNGEFENLKYTGEK